MADQQEEQSERYRGHNFITHDGARLMIQDHLARYEREVVMPRHEETQKTLRFQNTVLDKISGGVTTVKVIASILLGVTTIAGLVIGIMHSGAH